jgi:trypsin
MFSKIFILVALAAVVASSLVERDGRVVGGSNAALGRFPYMVVLMNVRNEYVCGATIVNNRWVLSAAHCFSFNVPQNGLRIRVESVNHGSGGIIHFSSRIVIHPNFVSSTRHSNIGLVQTSGAFTFNINVQPIALGNTAVGAGVNAMFSGYHINGPLAFFQTQTLTNADCRARLPTADRDMVLDHFICTFSNSNQG